MTDVSVWTPPTEDSTAVSVWSPPTADSVSVWTPPEEPSKPGFMGEVNKRLATAGTEFVHHPVESVAGLATTLGNAAASPISLGAKALGVHFGAQPKDVQTYTVAHMRGKGYSQKQIDAVLSGAASTEQSQAEDYQKTADEFRKSMAEGAAFYASLPAAGLGAAALEPLGAAAAGVAGGAAGGAVFGGEQSLLAGQGPREAAVSGVTNAAIGGILGGAHAVPGEAAKAITGAGRPVAQAPAAEPVAPVPAPALPADTMPLLATPEMKEPIPTGPVTPEEVARAVAPEGTAPVGEKPIETAPAPPKLRVAMKVDGKVIAEGNIHADILEKLIGMRERGEISPSSIETSVDGFVDQKGKFYSRDEAETLYGAKNMHEINARIERGVVPEKIVKAIALVDGKQFEGRTHGEALEAALKEGNLTADDLKVPGRVIADKFMTDQGRIVDSKEAELLAGASDSEDLGLNRQAVEREPTPRPLLPTNSVESSLQRAIEEDPSFIARVKEQMAGSSLTNAQLQDAAAAEPMRDDELSNWRPDQPIRPVDMFRANILRQKVWGDLGAVWKNGDVDGVLAQLRRLKGIEIGYNIVTGSAGRALQAQKVANSAITDALSNVVDLAVDLKKAGASDEQIIRRLMKLQEQERAVPSIPKKILMWADRTARYGFDKLINQGVRNLFDGITVGIKATSDSFALGVRGLERTIIGSGYGVRAAAARAAGNMEEAGRLSAEANAAFSMTYGLGRGFQNGLTDFRDAFGADTDFNRRPEKETSKQWKDLNPVQKTSRFLSATRWLGAITNGFATLQREAEIHYQAARIVDRDVSLGQVKPEDRVGRLVEMTKVVEARDPGTGELTRTYPNMPADLVAQADAIGREYTFMEGSEGHETDRLMKAITALQQVPGMRAFIPVARVAYNIERFANRRGGLLGGGLLSGRNWGGITRGGTLAAEAYGRLGAGALLTGAVWAAFQNQHINGAYPKDPRDKALWQQDGRVPFSVWNAGQHAWVKINKLPAPLGAYFMQMIAAKKAYEAGDKHFGNKFIDEFTRQLGNGAMDLPFLMDIGTVVQQIREPSSSGWNSVGKNLAGMTVPSPIRDIRNTMDKTIRAPGNPLEAIENAIPGLSQRVTPKVTVLGDIQKLADTFPWGWTKQLSAPPKNDPETNELRSLDWSPPMPTGRFAAKDFKTGKDSSVTLEGLQRQVYLNDMGLATRRAIKIALDEPTYQKETPDQRKKTLEIIIHEVQQGVHARYKGYLGIVDDPGDTGVNNMTTDELKAAGAPRWEARQKQGVITKEATNGSK
jgi:hypothetical protein